MQKKAVIFDLDGVIVSTDEYHYMAWKKLADEEGIHFDRHINERLRGVSRMASLEIVLESAQKSYSDSQKQSLAERKNSYYVESLSSLTPQDILPGVAELLTSLRAREVLLAIGSSSKNTPLILRQIGLITYFDAVSDGNNITKSKPDPEVFRIAAQKLNVPPERCIVVEDAQAGIEAAKAAGMKAVGVGSAAGCKGIDISAQDLSTISIAELLQ